MISMISKIGYFLVKQIEFTRKCVIFSFSFLFKIGFEPGNIFSKNCSYLQLLRNYEISNTSSNGHNQPIDNSTGHFIMLSCHVKLFPKKYHSRNGGQNSVWACDWFNTRFGSVLFSVFFKL